MDKAPDAFRTISEVAEELDVPQHVLRFWETRFTQIKPMKRSGGRRFYRPDDVDLLRGIRKLLYSDGYTIRGVQRILKEQGIRAVQQLDAVEPETSTALPASVSAPSAVGPRSKKRPAASVPPPEPAVPDMQGEDDEEAAGASIVVSPPLPKPFTTPLPSLELRPNSIQTVGMVPRAAIAPPPEPVIPKVPPSTPAPSYMPDLTFETLVPRPLRGPAANLPSAAAPQAQREAVPEPEVVSEPLTPARTAPPLEAQQLKPVLNELMAIRRLLDAAMQNGEP